MMAGSRPEIGYRLLLQNADASVSPVSECEATAEGGCPTRSSASRNALPLADTLEEFRNLDLESLGDFLDALQGEVSLSPFHLSDIRPVEITGFAHLFLRPVSRLPQLAHPAPEGFLYVLGHSWSVIG